MLDAGFAIPIHYERHFDVILAGEQNSSSQGAVCWRAASGQLSSMF
jgi:hypothetical protein